MKSESKEITTENAWSDCAELREIAAIMDEVSRSATARYKHLQSQQKITETTQNKDQS